MERTNESYRALKNKQHNEQRQVGEGLWVRDPLAQNLILIEDQPVNRKLQYNT